MANSVIKKDGSKASFDSEKIKAGVMAAALEAGLADQEAGDVASNVLSSVTASFEGQEEVSASDLRDKILAELDESQPSVATAWRKYEEGKGQ